MRVSIPFARGKGATLRIRTRGRVFWGVHAKPKECHLRQLGDPAENGADLPRGEASGSGTGGSVQNLCTFCRPPAEPNVLKTQP